MSRKKARSAVASLLYRMTCAPEIMRVLPCSHDFATRECLSSDRLRCVTGSFDDLINFSIHVSDAQSSDEGSPGGEGALLPRDGDLRFLSQGGWVCVEPRRNECGY